MGPTGRPRDIPTRTRGGTTPRCPDPVEGPTPRVLPGPSRITTLDFITGLPSNKRRDSVYNFILIIINRYIKIIKYLFIIKIIIVIDLTELIYKKIIYRFDKFYDIIFNRKSIFINTYWLDFYYYTRVKHRFSTIFYF